MNDQTSDPPGTVESKSPLDFKELLEAANDATNRTRYVSIVLLVASILIFIGLNNSYLNSWMADDLRQAYKPGDEYIGGLLDPFNKGKDYYELTESYDEFGRRKHARPIDIAKRDAQQALVRMHMESRLLLRIPILGLAIHVNDLGFLGGITLIVLLLIMRTSLSREIKNLGYSFKRALGAERLDEFYEALAMRQLITVPQMKGEKRNRFLSKAPYAICLLPVLVYLTLVGYDVYTVFILPRYRHGLERESLLDLLTTSSILWLMVVEGLCAFIIIQITFRCLERQQYLYFIWDSYWKLLDPRKDNLCLLEPDVATHFQKGGVVDIEVIKNTLIEESAKKINLLQRFWRAFKEENSPIIRFLFSRNRGEGKPVLIDVGQDVTERFSNDKQINDTLRNSFKRRKKQKDNSGATPDEKGSGQ
jgi:hypothetical protein